MKTELFNAQKDFLTDFYTKVDLLPLLNRMRVECDKTGERFSVLLIDVDHFKSFNDKFGHICGDEILKYFSSSLRLNLSISNPVIFRFGGDEFIAVFPDKTAKEVLQIASKLEKNIRKRSCLLRGRLFKFSFSGGVASYPADGNSAETILENADKAMYVSKRLGRGRVTQFGGIFLARIRRWLVIGLVLLGVCAILFSRGYLPSAGKHPLNKPQVPVRMFDTVYLKTGGISQGKIIQENDQKVSLEIKSGAGSMTITYSKEAILKIKRRTEK
jgi:diguanylate cyclase (GGDEF)-like protein